jgi:hypothetical protein
MTRDKAKRQAWLDWHTGMKLDDMPPGNPIWDIAFDAGWAAREAEHAAEDEREIARLIDEELL